MARVNPPTFADGNILSAAKLNQLGADIAFLYGIARTPIAPFSGHVYTNNGQIGDINPVTNVSMVWWGRHTERFLHYYFTVDSGGFSNTLRLVLSKVNADQTTTDFASIDLAGTPSAPVEFESSVDMDTYSAHVATDDFYMVRFTGNKSSGVSVCRYLFEANV